MRLNLTGDDPFRRFLLMAADGEGEGGGGDDGAKAADGKEGAAAEGAAAEDAGGEEGAAAAAGGEGDGGEKKPPKVPWHQRRIAELTRKTKEQERTIASLQTLTQQPAKAAEAIEGEDGGKKQDGKRVYTEDEVQEILRDTAATAAQAADFDRRCNDMVDKGKKAFEDFGTVVAGYRQFGGVDQLEKDFGFVSQVLDTDAPEKVLYELAKDPDTLAEVLEMTPNRRMAYLTKMADKKPAPKTQSKVPSPPNPVKGGNAPVVDPLDMRRPTDDWIANRQKEVEAKGNKRLIGAANR